MNNQPKVTDFLAQEISRLSLEKAYLQEALVEAQKKIKELEKEQEQEQGKGDNK